jgi:hypothetical protein
MAFRQTPGNNTAYGTNNPHNNGFDPTYAGSNDFNGGVGQNLPNSNQGITGAHGNMNAAPGVPPVGTLNNPRKNQSGGSHALAGKVEHAIGTLICSSSLKAKGLQKERYVQTQ